MNVIWTESSSVMVPVVSDFTFRISFSYLSSSLFFIDTYLFWRYLTI